MRRLDQPPHSPIRVTPDRTFPAFTHSSREDSMTEPSLKASACALAMVCAALLTPSDARADEGGVGFWLPGQYGSLIAAPQSPGWSLPAIAIGSSVDGGGEVAASRQITIGGIPSDIDVSLNVALDGKIHLVLASPTYTFADPVLGGQLSLAAAMGYGYSRAAIDGELTIVLPNGDVINRQGRI